MPIIIYIIDMILVGWPIFVDAIRGIIRGDVFDEKLLMLIASVGAMIIGERSEGVGVLLFFLVGEYFEHRATRAARSSIKSLMEIRPDTARVITDGVEEEVDAEDVEIGSLISIRVGERIPIDCIVVSGEAEVDTSALTGESLPRPIREGDKIESGTVLLGATVVAKTLRTSDESRASRILELVEEASDRKSREESFITSFSRYYTPTVIALALIMAVVPSVFGWLTPSDAIYRALSFLVVSCPCALVISVPMAFFGGIGGAARRGVLYKGGNVFAPIARAECAVFDKTGTLTNGVLSLAEAHPIGISEAELIKLAASAEQQSNHPIARGIVGAHSEALYPIDETAEHIGKGVVATLECGKVAVGTERLMAELGVVCQHTDAPGTVHVAYNDSYVGYLVLKDSIKEEARAALAELSRLGVRHFAILSGDRLESVQSVAAELRIDVVHAELLPEEKYARLESLEEKYKRGVIYVGDGINDAPCLARASVGIAMGDSGSDSAIEQADVVIMSDKLDRIATARRLAKKTVGIAKQNIVFAIGVKLLALGLVALNLVGMWMAVLADVGVAVLCILNSMRTLGTKTK
ncbi:MAG: cadmium-translocating P-type ATPase [Clostridia bacterium]|nr:cadmium-translocating P-type ATPase [Clostridia bacterium]